MRTKPQSLIFNVQNYYYFNGLFFQKNTLKTKIYGLGLKTAWPHQEGLF